MINITANDAHLAHIAAEWLQDDEDRSYDADDRQSIQNLKTIDRGLLVTGAEQTPAEADILLREVVQAELDSWVSNASQRLINRAGLVLGTGVPVLDPILADDHGPNPGDHSLIQDWVCGIFVLRCCTCAHLFKIS